MLHAATMVVAGVYLLARLYGVFWTAFDIGNGGWNPVAVIGGITIVTAALLAFVQVDIKKVLAYSTVSQLGYMVMGMGVGGWNAAVFHLFTHAFFKCLLFLGAGSISHSGSHHSFDMKEDMGGLRKHMPITFWTFVIGTLALTGFPLTAGFFSKDEIIATAGQGGYEWFYWVGLAGAVLTAGYMMRVIWLAFFGERRGAAAHHEPHESPWPITVPLCVLAFLSIAAGYLNAATFHIEKFKEWVEPRIAFPTTIQHPEYKTSELIVALIAIAIGYGVAYAYWFRGAGQGARITERNVFARFGYRVLVQKYYLDWLYEQVVVAGIKGPIAKGAYWVNQHVLDGVVNGAGRAARETGTWVYTNIDQKGVDGVVNGLGLGAGGSGGLLRKMQSGKVQQYGAMLFGAAAVSALVLVIVV
jgi:NADH-quinone oxidoreductase subunit L